MTKVNLDFVYRGSTHYMSDIQQIVQTFLDAHSLKHFWYNRFYENGAFIDLGIDQKWFQYNIENQYYDYLNHIRMDKKGWPVGEECLMTTAREFSQPMPEEKLTLITQHYKIYYIFHLLINRGSYLENFAFSAPIEHHDRLIFYDRYRGIIRSFCFFFLQQAHHIITIFEKNYQLVFPNLSHGDFPRRSSDNFSKKPPSDLLLKNFYMQTPQGYVAITARQRECLNLLCRGSTLKEISHELGITYKTVEFHVAQVKEKTQLTSHSLLIKAFEDSGLRGD